MTYTELLPADAHRSDEWYARRRDGVSASEIAAILGLSPYESPWSLWHRKKGLLEPQPDNDAMEWGRRIEELIVAKFEEGHPELLINAAGLVASRERTWQLATPDAIAFDPDTLGVVEVGDVFEVIPVAGVEAKTTDSWEEWGDEGSDDIPVYYRAQVLWQMDVLGVECVYVPVLSRGKTYREYAVVRDDSANADLEVMRQAALDFLDSLQGEQPPPIDSHQATGIGLRNLHADVDDVDVVVADELAGQYRAACTDVRQAEEWKAELENRLLDAIGSGKRAITADGTKVATRSVFDRTSIDTKALRADHPDLAKTYEKTTTVRQIKPAPQPKKKESIA